LPGSLNVISWSEFKARQPELALSGADLLYHFGVGLAFLATVRADGGPRLHPMCPLLTETGLYAFIVPSPKQRDLHRDGQLADTYGPVTLAAANVIAPGCQALVLCLLAVMVYRTRRQSRPADGGPGEGLA
jgi:hypothetical protein